MMVGRSVIRQFVIRQFVIRWFVIGLWLLAGSITVASPVAEHAEPPPSASVDVLCGPRSLVVVCQLLDIPATLREMIQKVEVGPNGVTMLNLYRAAQRIGLDCEAVEGRCALSDQE